MFMSTADAAKFIGVAVETMKAWRKRRVGPPYARNSIGDCVYNERDLHTYLAEHPHLYRGYKPRVLKKGQKRSLDEPMRMKWYPNDYPPLANPTPASDGNGQWQPEFYDPATEEFQIDRSTDPRYGVSGTVGGRRTYSPLHILQKFKETEEKIERWLDGEDVYKK
jgi:hypothetical protein